MGQPSMVHSIYSAGRPHWGHSIAHKPMMRAMLWCLAGFAALWAGLAHAAPPTSGTYMLEGGSYVITVQMDGGNLMVEEPNKTSPYAPQNDGSFHFFNPNTNTNYGIRKIDDRTIEAFKPGTSQPSSRLVLISTALPSAEDISSSESEKWENIANDYMERSQNDPANVQSWIACGGVALKRSISTKADADAYAQQIAAMLRQMSATSSPCPEVFSF